ncbi:MAG: phosphotransferase [Arenimonas sp.]
MTAHSPRVSDSDLLAGLMAVFGEPVSILARRPNGWASTFPSDVITCQLTSGEEHELLCKYGSGALVRRAYGHRRGPGYEAHVYQRVLQPLSLSSPRFFGAYAPPDSGETWIMIGFLGEGAGVDEAASPIEAMRLAAAWLGSFHAANEARLTEGALDFLTRYSSDYYAQWPQRTQQFAGRWQARLPWLAALCTRASECADDWLSVPPTIVHGEFTPSNVLIRGDSILPVDWESAAVGLGEIDLVSLVENWPDHNVEMWQAEYRKARWAGSPPTDFERRMDLAWLYWHFRWLGERKDWFTSRHVMQRSVHLRAVGERLGLL